MKGKQMWKSTTSLSKLEIHFHVFVSWRIEIMNFKLLKHSFSMLDCLRSVFSVPRKKVASS